MKKNYFLIKIFVIYLFLNSVGIGKESDYFAKGMEHFKKKEFNKSKIFFERDLAFNPKSEKSYLYLAKIFNEKKNNLKPKNYSYLHVCNNLRTRYRYKKEIG